MFLRRSSPLAGTVIPCGPEFAYTTALNTLLAPGSRRSARVADMTVVFC